MRGARRRPENAGHIRFSELVNLSAECARFPQPLDGLSAMPDKKMQNVTGTVYLYDGSPKKAKPHPEWFIDPDAWFLTEADKDKWIKENAG